MTPPLGDTHAGLNAGPHSALPRTSCNERLVSQRSPDGVGSSAKRTFTCASIPAARNGMAKLVSTARRVASRASFIGAASRACRTSSACPARRLAVSSRASASVTCDRMPPLPYSRSCARSICGPSISTGGRRTDSVLVPASQMTSEGVSLARSTS
ncbi:hypothetical protein WR25_25060 [Diploscapter pachys]|uniref:Uncharacterized protein n=1 Tax=Diploscapter pachys TaxID=2018661 RepID=A0A2A2M550_9BILA|nr:hypothetical protein WR25_25060 [Diploscapter pachys]